MRIASSLILLLTATSAFAATPATLPWTPQYKLRPEDKARLTAADVPGPDGIVYPNWTQCGVQGGIPDVKVVATLAEFGGKPDDDRDDADGLDRACQEVGRKGGGAVLLAPGTYYLDRPVTIRHPKVVIRGQGHEKTRLIFRYAVPNGIAFYWPRPDSLVGPSTPIELHAAPTGLMKMSILAGDKPILDWERSTHSGNTFNCSTTGRAVLAKLPAGPHTLKGVATYQGGQQRTTTLQITLKPDHRDTVPMPTSRGAIVFMGEGATGPRIELARDGRRGDTRIELKSTRNLAVGDGILIDGPATARWKELTRNACLWGSYRHYEARIEKIDGNAITLNQPLRIEFPIIDGSYVQKTVPIQYCGIEDLYIEQTENLWISTVLFNNAWNCWARGVKVRKCGRNPVYPAISKWCEIRDCIFDDAWYKGGGGTAYTGWEMAWDCLMENVETFHFRHAPLFQWAASGNVIRKSVFHDSDAQWHAGWTNENLIEQCIVESSANNGAYGFGMWASPPNDTAHGPNGPRNVVYNCDISSPKAGLWMGGMNENWLILHNRFVVAQGPGVQAKTCSFDHIIKGNVFVLKDGKSPLLQLGSADCVGVELIDNHLFGGNGKLSGGPCPPAVLSNNQVHPLADAPRPRPAVPSIYEWQKARQLKP